MYIPEVKRSDLVSFILDKLMRDWQYLLIIKKDGSTQYCDCIRNGKKPCHCKTGEWCNLKDVDQVEVRSYGFNHGTLYQVV